jgi:hypothetical protein
VRKERRYRQTGITSRGHDEGFVAQSWKLRTAAQKSKRLILELSVKTIYVRHEIIGRKNARIVDKATKDEREGKALERHLPMRRHDVARSVNDAK